MKSSPSENFPYGYLYLWSTGINWYCLEVVENRAGPVFLLSSAGRRVEFLRSLREGFGNPKSTIIAIDQSSLVPARYEADHFFQVPQSGSVDFLGAVSGIVDEFGVNYVIPLIDTELQFYAKLRETNVLPNADILVSSENVVRLAQDKLAFAGFLEAKNLPYISTQALDGGLGSWNEFPAFIKPRKGSSSKNSRVVKTSSDFLEGDFSSDLVIQPLRNGKEFTIDFAVSKQGVLLGFSIRERVKVRAGEVIVSVTRDISEVEAILLDFVRNTDGLYGVLNLQVVEFNGVFEILELNARVGGGYPLTFGAGCDLFRVLIRGDESDILRTEPGYIMLRHDQSIIIPSDMS